MHVLRLLGLGPSALVLLLPAWAAAQPPPDGTQPPPDPGTQAPPPEYGQQPPPPGYGQQPPPAYGAPAQGGVPVVQHGAPGYGAPMVEEEPRPAPNSVFAEGLGAGLYYSINYERLVVDSLGVRIGFSYVSLSASASSGGTTSSSSSTYLGFPITASFIGIGGGKHRLELGGGATLAFFSGSASGAGVSAEGEGLTVFGTGMIGYRIHPTGGAGFMFRVGLMGLVGRGLALDADDPNAIGVLPWFYISAGASF